MFILDAFVWLILIKDQVLYLHKIGNRNAETVARLIF